MLKKWFPRGVLTAIICGLAYLMSQTWGLESVTYGTNFWMLLFWVELGVMIAALSLLVETFLSKDFQFNGSYPWPLDLLYGSVLLGDVLGDDDKNSVMSVHICTLMMMRSMAIVMFGGIFTVMAILMGWLAYETIIFLSSPYIPEIKPLALYSIIFLIILSPLFAWLGPKIDLLLDRINNISSNPFYRVLICWATISSAFSLMVILSVIMAELSGGSSFWEDGPLYVVILQIVGVVFATTGSIGLVIGMAFGLYWLARKMILRLSMNYSWLNELWNTVCPIVEVRVNRTRV